jgi:hypothetical protein
MPVKEFVNLAFIVFLGIAVTHPMTFAVEIRKIELSILRAAADTRSWGDPVHFPEHQSYRKFAPAKRELTSKSR